MNNRIELVLPPEQAADEKGFRALIARAQGIPEHELGQFRLLRRSIDARSRQPKIRLIFELASAKESLLLQEAESRHYQFTGNNIPVAVIGSGPAGLFAAIRLIELGYKPVIIERGKDVRERRRDLAALHREMQVNPDSNYCFGEGGAGTYSDGKLYTRSDKRGNVRKVLDTLIEHGADPAIGIDAHPHIGTNKLPGIISSIRERIIACGGEVHFNTRLAGIKHQGGKLTGATLQHIGNSYTFDLPVQALILATGHSARDIYQMLYEQGILIEQKPFALGVRIEHPQQLIDSIQYHCESRGPYLPAASYSLSAQSGGRGVYSFCMCPGGIIAAAATAPGEVVVNGWSPSKRNNKFANSGIVVSVGEDDFKPFDAHGPLKAMHFQSAVEQKAFRAAGSTLKAPAQRLNDFLNNKTSATLPDCSYFPGIVSVQLDEVLPTQVTDALRKGIREFGNKMRGYNTNEAVLVATESRTSSPVRIPRDPQSHMHPQIAGLFPCGEGAGYAGGIMSAAMDGERCADSVMTFLGAGKDI